MRATESPVADFAAAVNLETDEVSPTQVSAPVHLSHAQEIQRFFKTSVFGVNALGTFGNAGRNILRGPRFFNTDLGLFRRRR